MLSNFLKGVVERLWPEDEPEDEPPPQHTEPTRFAYNVLSPVRCKGCGKTNKVRLLIGADDDGSVAFFDSVRDAAAWRAGIPLADLSEYGGVEAYAVEDEEGS